MQAEAVIVALPPKRTAVLAEMCCRQPRFAEQLENFALHPQQLFVADFLSFDFLRCRWGRVQLPSRVEKQFIRVLRIPAQKITKNIRIELRGCSGVTVDDSERIKTPWVTSAAASICASVGSFASAPCSLKKSAISSIVRRCHRPRSALVAPPRVRHGRQADHGRGQQSCRRRRPRIRLHAAELLKHGPQRLDFCLRRLDTIGLVLDGSA